jgi:hypothetical protein
MPDLPDRPYSRQEFAGALAANAVAKPFNLALLLVVFGGGLAVGSALPLALVVALLVYAAACARTFLDGDEADRVLTGIRAQLLHEVLEQSPPQRIERRLAELEGSGKTELIDALRHQLGVQRKVADQLDRFYDEMERVVVELDTVRGTLVSVSASTDAANQQRLAADVRGLRDEIGALASGMSEAYEQQAATPRPSGSDQP